MAMTTPSYVHLPLFLQIAQGLEYLYSNQVGYRDIKSPNVLIWHFPSPQDSRQVRIRQSGNVWIKITDFGIGVSCGLTMKVNNIPVGTPGFMAPEMFGKAGQIISSEKVRERGEGDNTGLFFGGWKMAAHLCVKFFWLAKKCQFWLHTWVPEYSG